MAAWFFPNYQETTPQTLFGQLSGPEGNASLLSALGIIRQPYYRDIHAKAGALLRSMIKNHPFVDGNKRIGLVTTIDFLMMNGHILFTSDDELVEFALDIAKSEPDMSWQDVASWIRKHCVAVTNETATKRQLTAVKGRLDQMGAALAAAKEIIDELR